jgi:hypothetical protein
MKLLGIIDVEFEVMGRLLTRYSTFYNVVLCIRLKNLLEKKWYYSGAVHQHLHLIYIIEFVISWQKCYTVFVGSLRSKIGLVAAYCNHPSDSVHRWRFVWHSRHPAFPPIALSNPSQTSDDSGAVCMETTTSHHYRFSVKFWLRPQCAVLNVALFSLELLLLLPLLHRQLIPYRQMHYVYVSSYIYHTHTYFLFLKAVQQSGKKCISMV